MICEKVGNVSNAEKLFKQAITEEEFNYWLYYRLAQFYQRIGKYDLENKVYRTAYNHYFFYKSNQKPQQNDGIQYILTELLKQYSAKKNIIQNYIYRKYDKEVREKYKSLPEFKKYDYLDE